MGALARRWSVIKIKIKIITIQYIYMSCASNLGYGGIYPNSNVNPAVVNVDGSTYAGGFGSNEIPSSSHSMRGASNNVAAASGNWTGGGSRRRFRRRNNISKLYRMKKSMRRSSSRGRRSNNRRTGGRRMRMRKSRRYGRKPVRRTRRQRGGYTQFDSNVPYTPGYSLGGPLSPSLSALANPPIYHQYNNCKDNYNHYEATQT
jgi:hypothetical protein